MSLQGPIVIVGEENADLAAALEAAGASSVIASPWARAAAVIGRTAPAGVVVGAPDGANEPIDKVKRAIGRISGPYLPVIGRLCRGGPALGDALPIAAEAPPARVVARLAAAQRVRTLHATVLRRAASIAAECDDCPPLPDGDPLDDATVLVAGRGRSYPALTTAVGERLGLIGALGVETAARYLNARDVDGVIVGEGFGPPMLAAFLTALGEDSRFRDLPVALLPEPPEQLDLARLPNLERIEGEPAEVVERILPLVRLHAFEARLRRQHTALETRGMLDPQTGLFTIGAFLRDLARAVQDARERRLSMSIARFSFPPNLDRRSSIDAARLVSRMVRKVDFACRASDGSILLVFSATALRSAHVVARRIASVLRQTMLAPDRDGVNNRIDATVTLASLKPTDTVETLLARVSESRFAAA